jgi:hypothetical protein
VRLRREQPLLLRDVLLEDVGLQRAVELAVSAPWRSAATTYMQKTGTAGPLIVIEVVTSPRSMPSNSTSMSAAESMATPQCPTSPERPGVVGVAAHQGRHVEGDGQPAAAPRARIIL